MGGLLKVAEARNADKVISDPKGMSWKFSRSYTSFEEFRCAFVNYNLDISQAQVLDVPDYVTSPKVLLLYEGVPDGAEDYEELTTEVTNATGRNLSYFEFMFEVNNKVALNLTRADHVFYEGFSHREPDGENGPHRYWLNCGS